MMYKGHDLDLRTLSGNGGFAAVAAEAAQFGWARPGFRFRRRVRGRQPIWVDKKVLRVCNQAYDLAEALGAPEVGLEHLVHAMTQFEATSAALYEHNIHVSSLRRETTAIILEERSSLRNDGKNSPQKSADFEEILNQAAEQAYARRSPVSIADIIDALFDMSRDHPTRNLLYRNREDFELRDTASPSANNGRRKVRVSAGSNRIGGAFSATNGVPTVSNSSKDDEERIQKIARTLHVLSKQVAANGDSVDDLTQELLRGARDNAGGSLADDDRGDMGDMGADDYFDDEPDYRSDYRVNYRDGDDYRRGRGYERRFRNAPSSDVSYLVGRLEDNVNAKFNELTRIWSRLGERLKSLENMLDEGNFGGDVSNSFNGERFEKLEAMLGDIEERLQRALGDTNGSFDVDRMFAKLESVETLMRENPGGSYELTPVMSGLRDVEAGLRGIGGQIREVDSRTGDVNLTVEAIKERQERLEDVIETQQQQITSLLKVVREEIGNVTVGDGGGRDVSESINAVLSERFTSLASQMQHRMAQLEEMMKAVIERPAAVVGGDGFDQSYLQDGFTKIINNQHTLAGSFDEWRDDIAAIKSRIELIEKRPVVATGMPDDRFVEIKNQLNDIRSTIPTRRNLDSWTRFKMWLFGTSDWYGASWENNVEETRGWVAPRPADEEPGRPTTGGTVEPMYERSAYHNQRA